ncbi:hypothetical protein DFH06DRAFT_1190672 [Mycena polygramma]|nr:hypothetical protein DFH06DRAFT_1190672 [Mycena polygramma]
MRVLWLLWLRVLTVIAVPKNNTIDDASGLVNYLGSSMFCAQCPAETLDAAVEHYNFNAREIHNDTLSSFQINVGGQLEFNFTGTALYIFLALPEQNTWPPLRFSLDGIQVGSRDPGNPSSVSIAAYNVSVYSNSSIPDGAHTFRMDVAAGVSGQIFFFDYAIYTSNDPDPSSSSVSLSSGTTLSSSSVSQSSGTTLPSSSHTLPISADAPKKKPPVGAIAGAVIGAVALICMLVVGLIFARRMKRKRRNILDLDRSGPPSTETLGFSKEPIAPPVMGDAELPSPDVLGVSKVDTPAAGTDVLSLASSAPVEPPQPKEPIIPTEHDEPGVKEEVRALREELQQLKQQMQGGINAAAGSDNTSLSRSLSTMKREQTQALQQHGLGSHVTDALVHTDSGLRLTAGRAVDELPPTYVAD